MTGESALPDRDVVFEGVLLRDRYRVDKKLGQGGMATVYTATDTELGRKVVVKVPLFHFMGREGFKERFELEVKGLVDTEHPHVVSILARGDHQGIPYFIIQFLRGGSLEDRLAKRPQEPKEVMAWLPYVADALDFIHSRQIIHRDVKPGNILFDDSGNVFLSDFGVAKALGQDTSLTAAGFTVGSPHYMAPEQATNIDVGPATDQYALGVTVYESLAQQLPFEGDNAVEILIKKGSQKPRPLSGFRNIHEAISHAVERSLARDPKDRYPSCRAFAEALESAIWMSDPQSTPGTRTPSVPARHTMGGSLDISGLTLLGHYKVAGRLGSGGMGTVYEAEDTDLGKTVVIKVPHPRLVLEPGFLERFEREVTQLLRLEHPSIVRVLARGEVDGFPFYVLQYMKGGSLSDRLKEAPDRRQSAEDVLPWFESTARALDFLHSRRLIHRDVKPGNILFDEHDHAYLSDFGIAKAHGDQDARLTTTNTGVGSPRYMAPEQAGDKFEGRADQYALATTVFEALTGRVPFPDGTALEIMIKKMQETPPSVSDFVPDIAQTASDAVLKALSGDPEKRYPTCRAFFLAFKRALRGEVTAPAVPRRAPPTSGAAPAAPAAPPPVVAPITPPTPTPAPAPARRGSSTRVPRTAGTSSGAVRRPAAAPATRPTTPPPSGATRPPPEVVVPKKRRQGDVKLWQPSFLFAFVAIACLSRLAPFLRFVLPFGTGTEIGGDLMTIVWAVGTPAVVLAVGHGWLLQRRGVAPAWAWVLATLSGGALATLAVAGVAHLLEGTLHVHPLGVLAGGLAGLCLGFCQWLVFEKRLHVPWKWWLATTLGMAATGAFVEFSGARADALYLLVLASGVALAACQLVALRAMAPGNVQRGKAAGEVRS